MNKIAIIADSTSDLTKELRDLYGIDYCRMMVSWTDSEKKNHEMYADLDWPEMSHKDFFDLVAGGTRVFTTQVTEQEFERVFTSHLEKGEDIIYIGCSSRLSASVSLALKLIDVKFSKRFPNQKIAAINSCIACVGQGMVAIEAAKLRNDGKSFDEIVKWVEDNKLRFHQLCTVENLDTLKRAGRVKAGKAFFGNLFGLKPILISDAVGNNYAIEKQKGRRKALLRLVEMAQAEVVKPEEQICYITDAECKPEDIELLVGNIKEKIAFKEIKVVPMGPIIGASTGKGTIAMYFTGEPVTIVGEE